MAIVAYPRAAGDEGWVLVYQAIPELASFLVVGIVGSKQLATQPQSEPFDD